ncbi:hypothetical protein GCM10007927_06230 [Sulfitobacter pacificus]|uniref:Uncharacterized protein n=1 Tax=Sulfitobacter pacificus TaxID=1499314 RepID=A0ABQ5VFP3_9RHOB|nr:hypothetical protein GCM10007927_06230 [Sulfitobacter pacificus]
MKTTSALPALRHAGPKHSISCPSFWPYILSALTTPTAHWRWDDDAFRYQEAEGRLLRIRP